MEETEAMKIYLLRVVELKRPLETDDLPREVMATLTAVSGKGKPYMRALMKKGIKDLGIKPGALG